MELSKYKQQHENDEDHIQVTEEKITKRNPTKK
jgi:hypothetical protein